jgi:hypothetical protein
MNSSPSLNTSDPLQRLKLATGIGGLILVAGVSAIAGFSFGGAIKNTPTVIDSQTVCTSNGGVWLSQYSECENLDELSCKNNSGVYNRCASKCRHDSSAEICTQMCVAVCTFGKVNGISTEDNSEQINEPAELISNNLSDVGLIVTNNQDDNSVSYNVEFINQENLIDLMNRIQSIDPTFSFESTELEDQTGRYITSINGIKPEPRNQYWEFSVNGVPSDLGPSLYTIKRGDRIKFAVVNVQ